MTNRLGILQYSQDVTRVANLDLPWNKLCGKTVAISGATGLVGSFLIDVLMRKMRDGLDCAVLALGRSEAKARERLPYFNNEGFEFEQLDISRPGACPEKPADVVIHLASTTHPRAYSSNPIGTIASNVIGLDNLLRYSWSSCPGVNESNEDIQFLFTSSVEVYGKALWPSDVFDESYCGYIDCNTLRAGYPESKRVGESLCQAYLKQLGVKSVVARLPRTYGPTVLSDDSKAVSQFIGRAVAGKDIILKSEGTQLFSYAYVSDSVSGLLTCLLIGEKGEAYNIADERSNITLRDMAAILAEEAGTQVVFDLPDEEERKGYSTADVAVMSGAKLRALGWEPYYAINDGLVQTVEVLREMYVGVPLNE